VRRRAEPGPRPRTGSGILAGPGLHLAHFAPAIVLAALVFGRALGTFFAQDDITWLSRAAGLESSSGVVRPLSARIAFGIEYALFGLDPRGYHAVNLALHMVSVVLVYALGLRLTGSRAVGGAAATLFGVSAIAFTPLHWATGIVELLTGCLLLGATLLWLEARHGSGRWRWVAALLALAAMSSKETAAAWVLVVALIEARGPRRERRWRVLLPAVAVSVLFAVAFLATGQARPVDSAGAYAGSASPLLLAHNLSTYALWCVALHEPIRDVVAAADPRAWRIAVPLLLALGLALWRQPRTARYPVEIGMGWWLAFLLPVLPLAHHTYLYYLYIPWAGGAIAAAALGRALCARCPRRLALAIGLVALGGYALVEARNVAVRETATRDALPVDRTMRDAVLLSHALPVLRAAALPPGTRVAFVNPVPRARFDVMTGSPTRPEDRSRRESYWPLEAALRGGETLRLFLPGIEYLGFANTIPPDWEDAECFRFEQRGWLEPWGRGQRALMRQAAVQLAAREWSAAESTFRRVRALGDTLPGAVQGQIIALAGGGRSSDARSVASEFVRRWPDRPLAPGVRSLVPSAQVTGSP
jgi:hypothetical protein